MSYAIAIEELKTMVPELYTHPGQPRRKFSLDQMRTLLHALADPQLRFRSVLIAGTNGKGSTAATLASILSASGIKTGLYTSPHLIRPNERIRLGDEEITDEAFAQCYFTARKAAQDLVGSGALPQPPSFFEILTAMAFLHFAERGVEVAVLEVGMGGRLDATNVVEPLLSVITDISLDHMEWLGSTIGAIAREKAGILRQNGCMVTLPQHPEANQVLGEVAMELGVRGINAAPYMPAAEGSREYPLEVLGKRIEVDSPLVGEHQHRNVALAMAAAVELAESHGMQVTAESIAAGIRATNWPGRLERITRNGVEWILDVAHNPAGAWALRAGLRMLAGKRSPRVLVFSCLADKPAAEMAQILFPLFECVILAPLHTARATAMEDLEAAAQATAASYMIAGTVPEALGLASERFPAGAVVISGSVYLVGEARAWLTRESGDR